jgi:hypothetical protein
MRRKCSGPKAVFRFHTPYPGSYVFGCAEQEARVSGPFKCGHCVVVACEHPVPDEGREFEVTVCDVWSGGRRPYLNVSSQSNCEMSPVWSKDQRIDFAAERKVVEDDSARHIRKDRVPVEIYCEEEVALRIEREAGDVLAVCEGKRVRCRAVAFLAACCVVGCARLT